MLSEAVASRVGELLAASEEAARVIRAKAEADADTLTRTATQAAVAQAQQAVAAPAEPTVPQLEASVTELRELVEELRADVERLTNELTLLGGTEPPSLPPPERPDLDRRALLIAFNMASNGATREEAARYLADNLDAHDCDALLDAVFAHVGSAPGDPPAQP